MRVALTVAFLVVPLLEVFVIVSVGQVIGGWQTVGLLFVMSILGTWVVRREGASAWRELQGALGSGRIPGRELADAALVLVGGTLLLTPGFLTDVVGLFFLLPFTRPHCPTHAHPGRDSAPAGGRGGGHVGDGHANPAAPSGGPSWTRRVGPAGRRRAGGSWRVKSSATTAGPITNSDDQQTTRCPERRAVPRR